MGRYSKRIGRYLNRDRAAIAAGLVAPLAAAAVLLPFRASWSNTNVALVLVVVVVAVAAIGNRAAGGIAPGLPAEEIELRTFGNGQFYGRFMLQPRPGTKPSLQARLVAVTLADQAGRAFGSSRAARGDG